MSSDTGKVLSVNISEEKGTIKKPVDRIVIDADGVVNDAHAGHWHRQVSLLAREDIAQFETKMNRGIAAGEFAENITTEGVDIAEGWLLDRFRIGEVDLEVTQLGKECHGDGCAIFREMGKCVMPTKGIFTRVVTGGTIRPGDIIYYFPRILQFCVITLSDRASRGEYEDRSGPRVREIIEFHFENKKWHSSFDHVILPDDPEQLTQKLREEVDAGTDVIFTTGGTGIGPRDFTPEVVTEFADKLIPGIMEHIRTKYAEQKPNALLSRSVAAVKGETLIYTLPGSVKAVNEYTPEIMKTLEHAICMLNNLDTH